jgi:hypothetical protein
MKPISPVAYDPETRWGVSEITFAKDQPQYIPLPALRFQDGLVVTRWGLSLWERIQVLFGGSVYFGLLTYNYALQPMKMSTSVQEVIGIMADEDVLKKSAELS